MARNSQTTTVALIEQKVDYLVKEWDEAKALRAEEKKSWEKEKETMAAQFVTRGEFSLVRIIVFTMVGMILVAFFGAVINGFIPGAKAN